MRYPTITVPRARELIVERHARMHHSMSVESATADDCSRELRRRMLLIVTVPPHEEGTEHVFDLRLDPEQLHPLRQELLRDAERFSAQTRARVLEAFQATDSDISLHTLLQGVAGLAFPSQQRRFSRKLAARRFLQGENNRAIKDCLETTAGVFSGQLNGRNPETGETWMHEESLAYRAWQASQRIAEMQRRFRTGEPLEQVDDDTPRRVA